MQSPTSLIFSSTRNYALDASKTHIHVEDNPHLDAAAKKACRKQKVSYSHFYIIFYLLFYLVAKF